MNQNYQTNNPRHQSLLVDQMAEKIMRQLQGIEQQSSHKTDYGSRKTVRVHVRRDHRHHQKVRDFDPTVAESLTSQINCNED